MYDIDPKSNDIIKQDTLLHPVDLDNKFAITNPPYLARNKSKDKVLFDKYKTNDLYKCYILQLIGAKKHIGGNNYYTIEFFFFNQKRRCEFEKKFFGNI